MKVLLDVGHDLRRRSYESPVVIARLDDIGARARIREVELTSHATSGVLDALGKLLSADRTTGPRPDRGAAPVVQLAES